MGYEDLSFNPKNGLFTKGNPICKRDKKPSYDKKGALSAANKRYQQDHIKLRIYQCGNHWHLTHILKPIVYGKRNSFRISGTTS